MAENEWLLTSLEAKRKSFENDEILLPSRQFEMFQPWLDLLLEDDQSLQKRSKSRRSVRTRVRTLLVDVYVNLGMDVFFLCTSASTITQLATVKPIGILSQLQRWWETVQHPSTLSNVARQIDERHSLKTLIKTHSERNDSVSNLSKAASEQTSYGNRVLFNLSNMKLTEGRSITYIFSHSRTYFK